MSKVYAALLTALTLTSAQGVLFADEEGSSPVESVTTFAPFTGQVLGNKVRMRTSANLDAHVVRETTAGELFAVQSEDSGFYAVSPPSNTRGYIFRTFVLDGVVEGERVNVRLYPDIEAPVVAQLNTGDHIHAKVSDVNNKWLEVTLPENAHFYIAKEYIEKKGPLHLIADFEKRHHQASHLLSSAFLFAQSEIQKPFAQIDMESINGKFEHLFTNYADLMDIVDQAREASHLMHELYVQKKIAFLESRQDQSSQLVEFNPVHIEKLANLGIHIHPVHEEMNMTAIAEAASETVGYTIPMGDDQITDKMMVWQPLEESLYHLWAATHGERGMDEFYAEESQQAKFMTGMIETYNRPVKNLPGDYLIRLDNQQAAFLYSTKVNLQHLVGKQVTVIATPRPDNNFAFPAYFVLSVD